MKLSKNQDSIIYVYKGISYFEKPKHTQEYKREFDVKEKYTRVYVKKKSVPFEVPLVIVLLITLVLRVTIRFTADRIIIPEYMNYYNGTLYTNIISNEENKLPMKLTIQDKVYVLQPGEYIKSIDIDYSADSIEIKVSNRFALFKNTQNYVIDVRYIVD